MAIRENAGYRIINTISVGSVEVVLGECPSAPAAYVTWECRDGSNYYWGHYHTNRLTALRDLLERAGQELDALERRVQPQHQEMEGDLQ